ncbi:MAG: SUMF1/EgtB/PvdO family nonheme iron enzyme, partial [Gammaproteobacteria bacterium]|nr:SUMF1/EgtB/PvdO family nonheme iron enzyme [Gammaproteobacteria bacterium]
FPQGVHLDEADDLHWADSKSYRSDRDTHFGEWPNCRHTRERNAWLEAKAWPFVNTSKGSHEQDLAAIEKHLQQFPEGDHVGKVRARIQRLKDEIADRDRWLAALEANTESSYSNYLENSLDQSEFIDKAHAELAWIETRKSDSTEAYQNFRKSHPGTRHWTKADRWLQDKRWERVTEVNSFSAYEDYLLRQPADHHVEEARVRVQDTSWEAAKAENSVAGYEKYLRLYPTGHHSSAAKQALSNASIPEDAIKVRRGRKFSDCKGCPRMIEIAAGSFLMGTPWSEWHWSISYEGGKASVKKDDKDPSSLQEYFSKRIPRHSVSFSRPFAIGIHEVTVDEFSLFVKETGFESETNCTDTLKIAENDNLPRDQRDYKDLYTASWRNPGFKQSGSHPVVCIGVQDAKQYATWLSQKTGNRYRLPTEAEWEYAARAGTLTPFFSGDTITQKQANCCDIPATGTKRVSAYKANGFGLRNTYGNACEFTEDCISQTYTGSVAGVTIDSDAGECAKRWTVRGGGFYWGELLATSRIPLDIGSLSYHSSQQGFRIVRDL